MKFDIITIFPEIFEHYFNCSILKKAQEKDLIKIRIHNLRDFTADRHKTVDDRPYGGGLGMVLKIEPIYRAIQSLKSEIRNSKRETNSKSQNPKSKIVLFTPRGKQFNQRIAWQFSKLNQIIMICGRYEGIDERVLKYIADEKISIGNYVLMGGELPALILIESVARLIPGVIGKTELFKERITKEKEFIEYPQYTRPEKFVSEDGREWKTPKVLLSGDNKKIEEWRSKHGKKII